MNIRRTARFAATLSATQMLLSVATANINLELRPLSQAVEVGDPVQIGIYAVSDSAMDQPFTQANIVFTWDPSFLTLDGLDNTGAAPFFRSNFNPTSPVNETFPPADGDAMYSHLSMTGSETDATPAGTLLTTLEFTAVACAVDTPVAIVAGVSPDNTVVRFGFFDRTGTLGAPSLTDISGLPVAPDTVAVDRNDLCADDAGDILLTASGGSGDVLNWYDDMCGGNLIGSGTPLVISSPAVTTTYYARWENVCGVTTCEAIEVVVYPLPTPSITATPGTLNCDPVMLSVDQTFASYLWSPSGETTQSISVATNGTYSVSVMEDNGCTNTAMIDVTTIEEEVLVQIDITLQGFDNAGSVTRCLRMVPDNCGEGDDVLVTFDSTGTFSGTLALPCGEWTQLCLKDQQHSLWETVSLTQMGSQFVADAPVLLRGGDANNTGGIDINDVTFLFANYGIAVSADSDSCPDTTQDGDFSNDGFVFSEDYTILSGNFNASSECACTALDGKGGAKNPLDESATRRTRLSTHALAPSVAVRIDVNRDGTFDAQDVRALETLHRLPHTLSDALTELELRNARAGVPKSGAAKN
ncbi:MAG: hypothetical protein AB7N71_10640 [Phycisphaerae bacterium]